MNELNNNEKNKSIEYILSHGLVTPQTTRSKIFEMFRTIGVRYIFWDTGYSLFFAALTLAIALALLVIINADYRYSAAVSVAPLMFLLINAFAETSERACGLYELKQTCRYTIRQITALRVLCYSLVGAAFTAVVTVLKMQDLHEFISMFTLCLSALFICAALSLSVMRYTRRLWANAVFSGAWVFASIALPFSLGKKWEVLLGNTPVIISAIIAVIGATALIYQISKMLSEVEKYAVA